MLKSLMLAVACAYINPPGLQPNAPVVEATVPEILKRAHAMEPGTQKKIIIDYVDGLCSKVMIEPSTAPASAPRRRTQGAGRLPWVYSGCRCGVPQGGGRRQVRRRNVRRLRRMSVVLGKPH
jgi:hypothetical protein